MKLITCPLCDSISNRGCRTCEGKLIPEEKAKIIRSWVALHNYPGRHKLTKKEAAHRLVISVENFETAQKVAVGHVAMKDIRPVSRAPILPAGAASVFEGATSKRELTRNENEAHS